VFCSSVEKRSNFCRSWFQTSAEVFENFYWSFRELLQDYFPLFGRKAMAWFRCMVKKLCLGIKLAEAEDEELGARYAVKGCVSVGSSMASA